MSADEFDVGHLAEPFRMPIELGKVREFARATSARDSSYFDRDDPVIPPTFLAASLFWQDAGHSGWGARPPDYERVLHGEQEFVFYGEAPRAGSHLTGRSRLERAYEKEGRRGGVMTFIEIITEFRDEDGHLVAEAISTSIETEESTA